MRSKSPLNRLATHGAAIVVGVAIGWLTLPVWREAVMVYAENDYGLLVEQCDSAMRDHLEAKQAITLQPNSETRTRLAQGEVGLIVCQDYDLYQKRLLQWGLREEELSQLRLKAVEARSADLEEVVATHEIRY